MDFEQIKNNLMDALGQLAALRMIVTSRREKVADLPALYVLLSVLLAPGGCLALVVLGWLKGHAVRFEKDAVKA